jgi:hypothetical protein
LNLSDFAKKFTCEKYHLDMPAATADDFCARRRIRAHEGDFCLECERGIRATKNVAEKLKSNPVQENILGGGMATSDTATKCSTCGKHPAKEDGQCGWCLRKSSKPKKPSAATHSIPPAVRSAAAVKPKGKRKANGQAHAGESLKLAVLVDFGGHPETHARLLKLATEEHRTPELQLLHIIDTKFLVEALTGPMKKKGK